MRPYRIFGLVDSLIYLGPLLALLVALVFVPGVGKAAVGLAAAAWAFVASRYFWPRWKTKQSIEFYSSGFAVIPQGAPIDRGRVQEVIATTIVFWEGELGRVLDDVGEGGVVAVYVSSTGIRDVRFPSLGPAHGLTSGNHIRLAFDPDDPERFYAVLGHEIGHACLNAVGFQGDHHVHMALVGRL